MFIIAKIMKRTRELGFKPELDNWRRIEAEFTQIKVKFTQIGVRSFSLD